MSSQNPSDEAMMNPTDISMLESEVEARIRSLQPVRQRLMFSELAEAFPDCTWQILFNALGRLSKQKHIELVAHRWDYELIFLSTGSEDHARSGTGGTVERCEHDERAHV